MILGIDASNIRVGGGATHLIELLRSAEPTTHGFDRIIVWGREEVLGQIDERDWLVKSHQRTVEKSLMRQVFWQRFKLAGLARQAGCDLLFVPGGSYPGGFRPFVTMSRNLLPFEWRELRRFGWSRATAKMLLLRWSQSRTFRGADGLVFLTQYAHDTVLKVIGKTPARTAIVPHGIDARFNRAVREQSPITEFSDETPYRVLYVSTIEYYKHQWLAARAIARLRASGLPVTLELVGPAYSSALSRLEEAIGTLDPNGEFLRYSGAVSYSSLHERYAEANLFLFASSCENMPNILLEAMAAGLPIACSNRGPMPEVLGDAGVFFDPENVKDIARALKTCIDSPELRGSLAKASSGRVRDYSWPRCANETFSFLGQVAKDFRFNQGDEDRTEEQAV